MVKLVDMPDLGSGAARRVGSSPIIRTKSPNESLGFFCGVRTRSLSRFHREGLLSARKAQTKVWAFFVENSARSLSRFIGKDYYLFKKSTSR